MVRTRPPERHARAPQCDPSSPSAAARPCRIRSIPRAPRAPKRFSNLWRDRWCRVALLRPWVRLIRRTSSRALVIVENFPIAPPRVFNSLADYIIFKSGSLPPPATRAARVKFAGGGGLSRPGCVALAITRMNSKVNIAYLHLNTYRRVLRPRVDDPKTGIELYLVPILLGYLGIGKRTFTNRRHAAPGQIAGELQSSRAGRSFLSDSAGSRLLLGGRPCSPRLTSSRLTTSPLFRAMLSASSPFP